MTTYRVQHMTKESYHRYMCGYNDGFRIENEWVEACDPDEAKAIVRYRFPDHVINDYVESKEEIEEGKRKIQEAIAERDRKDEEKKARKAQNELRHAEEMGMALEQYQVFKSHQTTARRYKREIENAKAQIKDLEEEIRRKENYIQLFEKRYGEG